MGIAMLSAPVALPHVPSTPVDQAGRLGSGLHRILERDGDPYRRARRHMRHLSAKRACRHADLNDAVHGKARLPVP